MRLHSSKAVDVVSFLPPRKELLTFFLLPFSVSSKVLSFPSFNYFRRGLLAVESPFHYRKIDSLPRYSPPSMSFLNKENLALIARPDEASVSSKNCDFS